jgi:hypothetical protein
MSRRAFEVERSRRAGPLNVRATGLKRVEVNPFHRSTVSFRWTDPGCRP